MDIDAFIFIGGKSSRFGSDKANFVFDGVTLAERAWRTVNDALKPANISFIAGSADQAKQFSVLSSDVPMIFDIYPDRGAIGALHAALNNARSEWIFVLACDFPFVSAELIRLLAKRLSAGHDAVVPVSANGRLQPLCAFYRVEAFLGWLDELVKGQNKLPSLKEILQSKRACLVGFDEFSFPANSVDLFLNLNTRADLRRADKMSRD